MKIYKTVPSAWVSSEVIFVVVDVNILSDLLTQSIQPQSVFSVNVQIFTLNAN